MSDKKNGVTPWVDPAKYQPFKPNKRQKAFKQIAETCIEEKEYFKLAWFKRARAEDESFKRNPIRLEEWERWCESPTFLVWFYKDTPQSKPVDKATVQMLEHEFWVGVQDGLIDKKEWAYKLFAKLRFVEGKANRAEDEAEIKGFIGAKNESDKWQTEPAEA